MTPNRMCGPAAFALACIALLSAGSGAATAQPAGTALVIGNGTYASLPAVPACPVSAHAVAAALGTLGFDVIERTDASSGGVDAAIAALAKRLADKPGGPVVMYFCGHAMGFNGRPFVLPASATITRPSDALTQGVLAKALFDVLVRGNTRVGIVAIDIVPVGDASVPIGTETLAEVPAPDGVGAIAVTGTPNGADVTPLATALTAALAGPTVQSGPLLAAVQQQLTGVGGTAVGLFRPPVATGYLAGAPPPPLPPAQPGSPAVVPPAALPAVAPAILAATIPDEAGMTEANRQRVQDALVRLGYYAGRVDGVFGPETRAAIRRFQHEIGAEMTGRLTAEEANRLVAKR
ncbi:peptidoglycan-binding protein [Limobrevibacterium gyesilva]|uniref:Peptidoglycan-binding protein n=1 Tax=Limobrevibacterium gyesilva TaxID=2991712 RepID=A0AA41YSA5_9PROT|nr:peptidoglycan-binding protein [Limobrevibacterium gyesilva]MCW3475673.1 peptidoglycan-binding protein [Limobrevibacterium gyesilva]